MGQSAELVTLHPSLIIPRLRILSIVSLITLFELILLSDYENNPVYKLLLTLQKHYLVKTLQLFREFENMFLLNFVIVIDGFCNS